MNSLNSILLEGNLVRDPESKQTGKGTSVCTFTVASNRFFRMGDSMQKEVSYFDVETWSALADRCFSEIKKGRAVRVIGRIKQDRWSDGEGQTRSRIKIVAEHVEFKPVFNKDTEAAAEATEDEQVELAEAEMDEMPV